MAGSDCSSATRSGANGASRLTYGSGARSGASETNPTCVPGPFRAGADTMSVSGERSTAAPPSAGSALRRDTVPRASLITTARASPVQPTIAGRRSKLSASGRTAPFTGETSSTRNVSAYVTGASETVTATQRPSGDHAGPPSAAGVATSGRVLPVATSTTDTSARTQSSPAGEGDRGAVRRPVERGTTHPRTHMPAHLDVLRGEQPGGRPGSVPRHVDQIEAREPLC